MLLPSRVAVGDDGVGGIGGDVHREAAELRPAAPPSRAAATSTSSPNVGAADLRRRQEDEKPPFSDRGSLPSAQPVLTASSAEQQVLLTNMIAANGAPLPSAANHPDAAPLSAQGKCILGDVPGHRLQHHAGHLAPQYGVVDYSTLTPNSTMGAMWPWQMAMPLQLQPQPQQQQQQRPMEHRNAAQPMMMQQQQQAAGGGGGYPGMQFQYGNSMHAPTAAALMAQTYAFQTQHLPPQRIMAQHIAAAIQPQPAARQTTTASQRRAARRKAGFPKVSDRAPGSVRALARACLCGRERERERERVCVGGGGGLLHCTCSSPRDSLISPPPLPSPPLLHSTRRRTRSFHAARTRTSSWRRDATSPPRTHSSPSRTPPERLGVAGVNSRGRGGRSTTI